MTPGGAGAVTVRGRALGGPTAPRPGASLRSGSALVLGVFLLLAACEGSGAGAAGEGPAPGDPSGPRPAPSPSLTWVGSGVCVGCHEAEARAWTGSDHERAMDVAGPGSVRGDFDDVVFGEGDQRTRFFRDGDRYRVATEGPDGLPATWDVVYTFGWRPLQQYLVELPGGRFQALTVAWDTERERWFSLRPGEDPEPGSWRHWTGGGANWNAMCADCHSTDVQRNHDVASQTYGTTFRDIHVGCEACHGPGSAHVAWARTPEAERPSLAGTGLSAPLDTAGPAKTEIDACAPCHAVRHTVAPGWVPGRPLLDHYLPELLTGGLYFPDGQAREEVFEYGSFLQSRMYEAGVRCSTCHEPHSTRVRVEGNGLCTRCHDAAAYDTSAHHFHPAGSSGARCVACHMPAHTFMQVDARRDHGFRVPRPDLAAELGTPDPCTDCHEDRTEAWAAARMTGWYGATSRDPRAFARVLAAGRSGEPGADTALARLAADTAVADIARATAVSLLEGYPGEAARRATARALEDTSPAVRVAAVRTFDAAPPRGLARLLAPRLADPVRAVRVEAARVLARVAGDPALAAPAAATAFRRALDEYRASLTAVDDQPEGQLARGVLESRLGHPREAEAAYRRALALDASYAPARVNLATLLAGRGEAGEAESHLRLVLERHPASAEAHYALGLLLGEDPARMEEAAEHLGRAARAAPARPRIQYNAGLAWQHLERPDQAEPLLLAAWRLEPGNPEFLDALSIFYVQQARWEEALRYTDALLDLFPDTPELVRRRAAILRGRGEGAG